MAGVFKNDQSAVIMENRAYSILILAVDTHYGHIIRFISNLKKANPLVNIVLFTNQDQYDYASALKGSISEIIYRETINKAGISGTIIRQFVLRKQFRQLSKERYFDIVNIHFPTYRWAIIMPYLKRMSKAVVATPWGSDILRRKGIIAKIVCSLVVGKCDYVTVRPDSSIGMIIQSHSRISLSKFYPLKWGSETVDYIRDNLSSLTTEEAKRSLGINESSYVISCGYNAYTSQRHDIIIEAISEIKTQLPKNLVLLFPVTYGPGSKSEYIKNLRSLCNSKGIRTVFVEKYLSLPQVFELRMATDMFVHIQPTDSESSSVQEYIICGKKIVHGSWISYSNLEQYKPLFYYPVDNLSQLGEVIIDAYHSEPIHYSPELISYINNRGWAAHSVKWNEFFETIANAR